MTIRRLSRLTEPILLVALIVVVVAANLTYIGRSPPPLEWDDATHMDKALTYADLIRNFQLSKGWLWMFTFVDTWAYPPLVHILGGLAILCCGRSVQAAQSLNVLFLVVLLVSVYQVGRRLFNAKAGLLAGLIVSTYPMITHFAGRIFLEVPLAALVALSLWFLVRSNAFTHLIYSLLFGVSFGLGMLTKSSYLVFISFPLFVVLLQILLDDVQSHKLLFANRKAWFYAMLSLALGLAISALWYGPQLYLGVRFDSRNFFTVAREVASKNTLRAPILSMRSLTYYLRVLPYQISPFYTLVFLVSLVGLRQSLSQEHGSLLLLSLVGPLLVQTINVYKTTRQDIGILPSIALISAIGMLNLRPFIARRAMLIVIVPFALYQLAQPFFSSPAVQQDGWASGIQQALIEVATQSELSREGNPPSYVELGVISDHRFINGYTFSLHARLNDIPVHVWHVRDLPTAHIPLEQFLLFDFLVLKSDWVPPPKRYPGALIFVPEDVDHQVMSLFHDRIDDYALLRNIELPDGSGLLIYQRKTVADAP